MTTILSGLRDPLPGERVLAVHPRLAPHVANAEWRRRTNFFTGRSVGATALAIEQAGRGGALATQGQLLTSGVGAGLEARLEQAADENWFLEVAPGFGLTVSGEDVRLTRPLRIAVDDLPVTLTRANATATFTLGQWLGVSEPPAELPGGVQSTLALILVLQPIQVRRVGQRDLSNPCELSPEDIAFEDDRLVDGARLRVLDFPAGFTLPSPADAAHWRNRLAYEIFSREAALGPGQHLPWEDVGLGIALLGVQSPGAAPFVDVNAVAREGGHLRRGRALLGAPGTPALWQARVRQFIEQLEDVGLDAATDDGLAAFFDTLPPVSALPSRVMFPRADGVVALDVRGDRGEPHLPLPPSPLFPAGYVLETAPVELESLDDYLRASANLSPLALDEFEQVQVLVPVPHAHFSPDLLRVEDETPDEFREAVRLFLLRLNHRLGRRRDVRDAEARLQLAVFGSTPDHPSPDSGEVLGEADSRFPSDDDLPDTEPVPAPEERFADSLRADLLAFGERVAKLVKPTPFAFLLEHLRADLQSELPSEVPSVGISEAAQRFANQLFAARIEDRAGGLTGFVEGTSKKLVTASEAIDVAFTRTANELYRVRSLVSGEVEATQLASSPALPFVVKNRLAAVTPAQLSHFKSFLFPDPSQEPTPITRPTQAARVESRTVRIPGAEGVPAAFVFTRNIRDRLAAPFVLETRDGAERSKRAVFRTLVTIHESGLSLDELRFPGFMVDPAAVLEGPPPTTIPTLPDDALEPRSVNIRWVKRFLEFFDNPPAGGEPYWPHDPDDPGDDESGVAATAVDSIEKTIAALRVAEGRLAAFDRGLTLVRERMTGDLTTWERLQGRLAELEDEISEFRHDVLVARALEAEEIARARRVNAERQQVLRDHVPFLLFRRPRTLDGLLASPTHNVAPARLPDPVPACLNSDFEAPEQLRGMVDLLREAPLAWSVFGVALLPRVNRTLALLQVANVALHRAANPTPEAYDPFDNSAFTDRTGLLIRQVYESQRRALVELRSARLRFDLAHFRRFSWFGLVGELRPLVTLNDLLLTSHGRQEVSDSIARHLDDINRVVACLFEHLRRVTPFTRLQWMEQLREKPAPEDLRVLSVLPDWETVDPSEARDMQSFVNWLYQQIVAEQPLALQFMHDLVKMTILLASHAPINQSFVARPINVRPINAGGVIEIGIEAERLRVGMHVLLFEAEGSVPAVGQGVIEDLSQGVATVRVARTENDRTVVPVRAQVVEQDRNPGVELATGASSGFGMVSAAL